MREQLAQSHSVNSVVKQKLGLFPCSLLKDHPPLTVVAEKSAAVINEIAQIINIIPILQQSRAEQNYPRGGCANTFPLCCFSPLCCCYPSSFSTGGEKNVQTRVLNLGRAAGCTLPHF